MKICIISNLYSPYIIGGAEINTERLANALKPTHNVFVITTRPFKNLTSFFPSKEKLQGINVYRFYPLNLYHLYFSKKRKIPSFVKVIWHCVDLFNIHTFLAVLSILKKERPSIVHTNNLDGLSFSVFLAVKILKIPLVHTLRDYHLLCPFANLVCPLTKFKICLNRGLICQFYSFLKRVIVDNIPVAVTAPSGFVLEIHKKSGFFKNTIVAETVPNFVVMQQHLSSQKKTKDTLNFLFIGRLSKEKGIDVLIKAFKDSGDDLTRLNIVGSGPDEGRLVNLCSDDKRIKFQGNVNHTEVEIFYRKADVLVVPSVWYEVFGVVVIEAFSYGIPVIVSRIGGLKEIVTHGFDGFLFTPGDASELGGIFNTLSRDFRQNKELLGNLKKNAFESSKKYDSQRIKVKLHEIYKKALNAGFKIDDEN